MPHIKIVTYGNVKRSLNSDKILRWKSKFFSIDPEINEYTIGIKYDSGMWGFSDKTLRAHLPSVDQIMANDRHRCNPDLVVYLTNVPLEYNYFSRILSPKRVIITIHEIREILSEAEIPLENFIIAMLYAYSLMYVSSEGSLSMEYESRLAHNDANGRIFNQCGHKQEVIDTCRKPHLCDHCISHFQMESVATDQITNINSELRKLNRTVYNRLKYFIKKRPILALTISAVGAIILNVISGILLTILPI